MEHRTLRRSGGVLRSATTFCLAAVALAAGRPESAEAASKYTVAYIAPALDVPGGQWVAYGAKTKAAELGMDYVEMTSENSPSTQMNNSTTAMARGVDAIVMGPVSSASTPPVLRLLKQRGKPVAFTGIGP